MALQPTPTPLAAALAAGLDALSYDQAITFTLYQRVVLPLDGYVFWVKAASNGSTSGASALLDTTSFNAFELNQPGGQSNGSGATTLTVKGALHYTSDARQEMEQNYVVNRVIFSAQSPVKDFNEVAPDTMWLGTFDGVRFSFGARGSYFQQAQLHHYVGTDITPSMATQIVDDASQIDASALIVSNSLPSWLAINSYNPAYPVLIAFPKVPLYPSFLAPYNIEPPFGTIHIEPDQTTALQLSPSFDPTMSSDQLCHDRVTINLYGCNNAVAQDFAAALNQYTLDTGLFGIMGVPAVVRDDKQFQVEYMILAQKKRLIYEVSYLQRRQRDIARQLIEEVIVHVIGVDDFVAEVPSP